MTSVIIQRSETCSSQSTYLPYSVCPLTVVNSGIGQRQTIIHSWIWFTTNELLLRTYCTTEQCQCGTDEDILSCGYNDSEFRVEIMECTNINFNKKNYSNKNSLRLH